MRNIFFLLFFPYFAFAQSASFLDPAVAFKLSAHAIDTHSVEVRYQIEKGYYLYRERFKFAIEPTDLKLGAPEFPKGKIKQDELFGKVEVYYDAVKVKLPIQGSTQVGQVIKLKVTSQGCAEEGICYTPQEQVAEVKLIEGSGPSFFSKLGQTFQDPASVFKGGSFGLIVIAFFILGIGLSFTPCVFPMIPILSGIIVGQGQSLTQSRAFTLSVIYVLGMAITYTLAGVAAGLSGGLFSAALQNPWILGGFALIFVALAFSMFGFYDIQLPAFLQSKLSDASNRQKGGSIAGVFIMGVLSALIVGPCVAAPLAGALIYINQTRDAVLGGSALFAMSLGMGMPLLLIGASAGALLPRAGTWMEAVKKFFGVLLLAVAIWLISPVIPALVHMILWAVLLIISAMYLKAIDPLPHDASGYTRLWKGIGLIALIAGIAILIGALSGGRDILQPLAGLRSVAGTANSHTSIPFERVKTVEELDTRVKQAGKTVMLDFYADWCVSCKEMERFTFSDAKVQAKFKDMLLLQADVTQNSEEDKALLKRFNLFGPPGIIFFDKQGNEIKEVRVIGYQPAEKFITALDQAAASCVAC